MTAVKVASIFVVVVLGAFVGVSCKSTDQPDACRSAAYESAYICVRNDTENPSDCMSEVLKNYMYCTGPTNNGYRRNFLANKGLLSLNEFGKFGPTNVRCIVDNILDLAKCITDGELTDNKPFHWDWTVLLHCFLANLPNYMKCVTLLV